MNNRRFSVGLDFGTESVRALLLDLQSGAEVDCTMHAYPHGVIDRALPQSSVQLKPDWALQDPDDYLFSVQKAISSLLKKNKVKAESVVGLGVDFTSCTVMPTLADGTPLCRLKDMRRRPHAWPKLWKHHAAHDQAARINDLAGDRQEPFLKRYCGGISSEWLFPKLLQIIDEDAAVYRKCERFVEAGDWLVWQLTGQEKPSACQAGYKGMWSKTDGFPSKDFLKALNPAFENAVSDKLSGKYFAPGTFAGTLNPYWAQKTGLAEGTPVATAIIDAHAAVPGCGVSGEGEMVLVMGTSLCHMLMNRAEKAVEGVAGIVEDGILPGYFGYEAGQSAVGDIFDWFVRFLSVAGEKKDSAQKLHALLSKKAALVRPGESQILALDWWNGNRSVLMDSELSGMLLGLNLSSQPHEVYRALIESTAFGTRKIISAFEQAGVNVRTLYACGGLAEKNPLIVQIFADVTGKKIHVSKSSQSCAMGAAILGACAAGAERGGYADIKEAAEKSAGVKKVVVPNPHAHEVYTRIFAEYDKLHDYFGRGVNPVMKVLRSLRKQ